MASLNLVQNSYKYGTELQLQVYSDNFELLPRAKNNGKWFRTEIFLNEFIARNLITGLTAYLTKLQEDKKMDITEFTKQQESFLKADDVKSSPTKIFVPTGKVEMKTNSFGSQRIHIFGQMDGHDHIFDCSKTNARIISSLYSNNTDNWIGKQITLELYKTKTSEGKLVEAISVKEQTP